MAETMSGLFGPSPYEVEQQRRTQMGTDATNFANMNATQRGVMGMYKGAGMLAGAGAEAMGMVDPAIQKAQQDQSIQSQIDHTTAEGLMKGAQLFQTAGNAQMATRYVQAAEAMRDKLSERQLRESQVKKNESYESNQKRELAIIEILDEMDNTIDKTSARYKALEAQLAKLNQLKSASGATGGTGRTQTINTSIGVLNFDPYAKKYTYADGSEIPANMLREMKPIAFDVDTAGRLATIKAGSTEVGKGAGAAQLLLPKLENDLSTIEDVGNQLFSHPGYSQYVGATGQPFLRLLQGSNAVGAKALVDQLEGMAALMSRKEMQGQGQITEMEAKSALQAYSRMNAATSEVDFKKAYADFVDKVRKTVEATKRVSTTRFQDPSAPVVPTQARPANNNGYAGGSKDQATAGQIEILQSELGTPGRSEEDKASIRREIARLSGNKSVPIPKAPAKATTSGQSVDDAILWAKKNMGDPRAMAILKKYGG